MSASALPCVKIRPPARWQALNLAELWRFRDLLLTFALRDLKLRYRQTALGVVWVVLQPLMAAGIFTFVFGKIARLDTTFLSAYAGLLAWNAFNSVLARGSGALVQNSGLVSKVYFPRMLLPLSALLPALVDFLVALAMLPPLMLYYKVTPTPAVLLLPLWLVLVLALAAGCALLAAALMVRYRDVQYVLPVLTMLLLYASPVAYSSSAVPAGCRWFYNLNPLAGLLDSFRWSLLGEPVKSWAEVAYSAALALAVLNAGVHVFKQMEADFADVI